MNILNALSFESNRQIKINFAGSNLPSGSVLLLNLKNSPAHLVL